MAFVSARERPGSSNEQRLPYREFLQRCIASRLPEAYMHPALRPLSIRDARKVGDSERFRAGPIYEKISSDTVQWFEEEWRAAEVRYGVDERRKVADFMVTRFLEINDGAFIARLEENPEGRVTLSLLKPDDLSKDRTSLVVSYSFLLSHSNCFIDVDMSKVREVQRDSGFHDDPTPIPPETP
jgi:hypothetical protein